MALRTNLITDPGNEAASTVWVPGATITLSHSTAIKYAGNQSLQALKSGSGSMQFFFGATSAAGPNSQSIPVTAGETYTFSCWFRHDNQAVTYDVSLLWLTDTAYQSNTASSSQTSSTSFTRVSVTGTAPAGATKLGIGVTVQSIIAGNSVYLDNALLEKASAMGTYFDGSTVTPGLYYAWTGPANASTSTESNVAPGSTVLLDDNFDRANSTTTIGSPQTGPAPVVQFGVGGISSNQLYSVTAPLVATYDLGTANVELSFIGNSMVNGASLVFGYAAATDYYYVFFQYNVGVYLYQVPQSQSAAQLAFSAAKLPAASGSVCKAHYRAGVIRAYVDGVMVIRWALDVPITATKHGVRISSTSPRIDNLLGTDAPVISDDRSSGQRLDLSASLLATDSASEQAYLYRGRDTKLQDETAGA